MAVSSVASAPSLAGSLASAGSSSTLPSNLGLSQSDFMNLLTTQLQYQDPTNPVSSADLVTQLSQFSSVQSLQQLNTNFSQMLMLQQLTQAANLIGKQISFTSTGKALPTTGTVSSVQINSGQVAVMVGSQAVALNQITSIAAGTGK